MLPMIGRTGSWKFTDERSRANLEDLQQQLVGRIGLLLMGIGGTVAWLTLPRQPFPLPVFLFSLAFLGKGFFVRLQNRQHPSLARRMLIWGSTGLFLLAISHFAEPWLPFLGVFLIFTGAVVIPGSEVFITLATIAQIAWLETQGGRTYPIPALFGTLMFAMALSWLMVNILYTALQWAWTMQQRAGELLEEARDRQVKLADALQTLDIYTHLVDRANHDLFIARRQAEEARRMKEQFAANVSHELRTPLNLILGFSEMMYLSPEVYGEMNWPTTLRRDIYQIYRSSRHLSEMIDDILDLSRFEITGFVLNREPTEVEPLLQSAIEIAEGLSRSRPISLEVEIEPDLPILEIDRTRIRQVVLNLLSNAHRFTREGVVRLEAKKMKDEVVISVSDTGPGIPADKIPYIFEEFYQVDGSLRRPQGGVGLGLAISKRFVNAHDGRIWVESQEGKGSTFFFSLPIPGCRPPTSYLQVNPPVERPWHDRPSILVLERDPSVVALLRRHLEGYRVIQVESGDRLDEEIALHHPQAVIRNVLPAENGYSLAISSSVPVIDCSLPSQAWRTTELGIVACLTKPITATQLKHEMERVNDVRDLLLIDDDRGFCQLVERMLTSPGRELTVRHAYDGLEGIQMMRERRPDLILLDLVMPGADGFQVLAEMRQDPTLADVPVILLTATSYAEDTIQHRGSRMVIHRRDGLQPGEVLRCLQAVMQVLQPHYEDEPMPNPKRRSHHAQATKHA